MTERCVNPDCGRKKMFPSEGSYLAGGRWFCCWSCKTAIAPDEPIFRTKEASMEALRCQLCEAGVYMDEYHLVPVQANPEGSVMVVCPTCKTLIDGGAPY